MLRRAARPESDRAEEDAPAAEVVRLPVPVERVSRIHPRDEHLEQGAAFAAQLIGQDGRKRGLRAGEEAIAAAKTVYNRTEWSGAKDRRAPAGRTAKTKI